MGVEQEKKWNLQTCFYIAAGIVLLLFVIFMGLSCWRIFFQDSAKGGQKFFIETVNTAEFKSLYEDAICKKESTVRVSGPEDAAEIKKELFEALSKVDERANAAYNEKFATLLTMLTIFGIAWPILLGLMQQKEHDKKIEEIEERLKNADKAIERVNGIENKIEGIYEKAETALKKANKAEEAIEGINNKKNQSKSDRDEKSMEKDSDPTKDVKKAINTAEKTIEGINNKKNQSKSDRDEKSMEKDYDSTKDVKKAINTAEEDLGKINDEQNPPNLNRDENGSEGNEEPTEGAKDDDK